MNLLCFLQFMLLWTLMSSAVKLNKDSRKLNASRWVERYSMVPMRTSILGGMAYESNHFTSDLPSNFNVGAVRPLANHIMFLIEHNSTAYFHKFPAEAILHHYVGPPLDLFLADEGIHFNYKLSTESPIVVVPAGTFVALRMVKPKSDKFSVFGCTLVPGTIRADITMAKPEDINMNLYGELLEPQS